MPTIKDRTVKLIIQDKMADLFKAAELEPSEKNVRWASENLYIFENCTTWEDAIAKLKGAIMFKK